MTPETERTCLILSNQILKNTCEADNRRIEVLTANLNKAEADLKSAIALNGAYNNKVVLLEQGLAKMPTNLMMADLRAKLEKTEADLKLATDLNSAYNNKIGMLERGMAAREVDLQQKFDRNERLLNSHIGYYKTELASMQSKLNVAEAKIPQTITIIHGDAAKTLDEQQHLLANAKETFQTKLYELKHHADYVEDQLRATKTDLVLAQEEIHKKSLDIARLTTSMDKIHGLVEYEGKST